ncbi:MAG: NADPH dehydrogenase NamA [Caldicoprobacterales bacterium]|jgi:NADPH2 dehydrogenase|nr:NADPH dehydrogenase NamA [Clostridiales bacterium]
MANLFSEFRVKNMALKNRIVMAPMCMYTADTDGKAKDWHYTHYTSRAAGGTGLIILEATAVEKRGRISDWDLGIWSGEHIEGLRRLVDGCHSNGAKIGVQLAHAGRKSQAAADYPIAPSPIPYDHNYRTPKEMNKADIEAAVESFRAGAERANEAGFDTIEIHAAHGYLINEFLSPLTNHRTDEYGGSMENRARFLKDILQAVASVWPEEKPVIVRVSAEEFVEGGNRPEDLANILNLIKGEGIDLVNVSTGGVVNVSPEGYPGYQIRHAEIIRQNTGLPVIAGGLITSPLMAEEIIRNERADLIFLGRELLRNPYWPLQAARELQHDIEWPKQYRRAKS